MTWTTRPRSDFGDLAAIAAGDGPLVVLLHGVGLRAEAWAPIIDALSQRFQVIAPDMPGHGESAMPRTPSQLSDYSNAIASALPRPAILVGHSMGAMIALDLAARVPDRVSAVAALNAIHKRSAQAQQAVRARADSLDGETPANPDPTLTRWFGDAESPERAACGAWLRSVDPRGYKAAYAVFAAEDGPADAELQRLRAPALFMTGAEERNSTPEMSRRMATLAPNGAARILPGAAHMMPMTHAPAVTQALMALAEKGTP